MAPFVDRIDWGEVDEKGNVTPKVYPDAEGDPVHFWPGPAGAKEWTHACYNPNTELLYAPVQDVGATATRRRREFKESIPYWGAGVARRPRGHGRAPSAPSTRAPARRAWRWRNDIPMCSSLLTTGGDLVFGGEPTGEFNALDAETGELLWQFQCGSGHHCSPCTLQRRRPAVHRRADGLGRVDRGLPARDARGGPGKLAVRLRAAGGLSVPLDEADRYVVTERIEQERAYDMDQAGVRGRRPLLRGHVLPLPAVGTSDLKPDVAARTRRAQPWAPDEFVARLRAQGSRYHNLHPFHVRMDAGELTRDELQRWVANRFYYQRCIPLKDAAILSNCPEVDVRREWIKRIIDHDGTAPGTGGIESWLRLGEALGVPRERARVRAARAPGGALRRRRLRELRAPEAVDRGGRVVADRAVRPGGDPRPPRGARGALPVDRPGGARVLPRPARAGAARRRPRARARRRALRDARAAGARRRGAEVQDGDAVGAARGDRARRHAAEAARVNRPRLVDGARLQYDDVREEHLLLVPEGAVRLNETAAHVLELCDGERSLEEIAAALSERYSGADVTDDVRELLGGMVAARAGGRCRRLGPTRSSRSSPTAARCTARTARTRSTIGGERWRAELETEHWTRVFGEARALGVAPARADRRRADGAPRPRRARGGRARRPACTRRS